jgi:hypothetical protein
MDQGIIASFKCKYCRKWIDYMLRQYEAKKNQHKTVNLLKAIQWTRTAWSEVSETTVQQCWWKSTVIKQGDNTIKVEIFNEVLADQAELQEQIAALPNVEDPLSIDDFIEPDCELINDQDGDIFTSVVERYSANMEGEEDTEDESDIKELKVSTVKALKHLEVVRLWELQQENRTASSIQALNARFRRIKLKKVETTT